MTNSADSGSESTQLSYGDFSAVAGPHGTATVNVYQQATPRQIGPDEIDKEGRGLARYLLGLTYLLLPVSFRSASRVFP